MPSGTSPTQTEIILVLANGCQPKPEGRPACAGPGDAWAATVSGARTKTRTARSRFTSSCLPMACILLRASEFAFSKQHSQDETHSCQLVQSSIPVCTLLPNP